MAVYDQTITTYSDTTPHVRVISNYISLIDPRDTPMIALLGGLDGARSKFRINGNSYKIELLEDEYAPMTDAVANGTVALTTNATNWTVSDASVFQEGDVILIDSEYMPVSAVDLTNNTITVSSRSYGGTNATHATNASIEIVSRARVEGAEADFGPIVDITAPYNYTQIFQKGLKITGSQMAIDQYGKENEFTYQANKAIPELMRLVEKSIFHGVRSAGSASAPRSMGGLLTFITDNSTTVTTVTKTAVDTLAKSIFNDGGNPDVFVCNPATAKDLKDVLDNSSFLRVTNEVNTLGTAPMQRLSTQYGEMEIVMDRWCPTSKAFMLDTSKIGLYTLRPFGWHDLAKVGDDERAEVIGEISLLVANDKAHGWIYGITST